MTVQKKMLLTLLTTCVAGTMLGYILWLDDMGGMAMNWKVFFSFLSVSLICMLPVMVFYFYLRVRVYGAAGFAKGKVILSLIALLLVGVAAYWPLRYFTGNVSGVAARDAHGIHFLKNYGYVVFAYAVPFVSCIWRLDRVRAKAGAR